MHKFVSSLLLVLSFYSTMGQAVKVMTYNIRYDTPSDSVNQWSNRTGKVYSLIRKYQPDILGIQEAVHNQVMDLVKNLPEYGYIGVGRDDGKTKGEYSAILYRKERFTILKENTFWLSETPEVAGSKNWDAAITRVATWAIVKDKISNKDIFVLNTHFDHIGKEARAKSAAIIKQKATSLAGSLPAIITGDFNCTREEAPYTTIMANNGIILKDAATLPPPGTFCGFKVNGIECRPIDYIFHSLQWKASAYSVINDNDGTYYPSDHLPVMVTLK